ncbi:AC4 [Sweet potato leaf curl Hubei virus]|uniref:AC4 n=1 Tax=Sweet potato leaf curl Hubei virus TaxID=2282485 RepID=A0A345GSF9_9GEMI|nr:AC4 [Sweet potato leaf curl Hubei virus]AXG65533.1 AC4 [Sweet potato leaf curl Hubei virus]
MLRIIFLHILSVLYPKKKHYSKSKTSKPQLIKNSSKSVESFTKMGALISTCFFSSRGNSNAKITDSSIWSPLPGQHISIQTFRELNPVPTSSPTSIRMETQLNGANSRLMDDLQGEDNNQPMTLTPQLLTQAVSQRLSELYGS